MIGEAEMKDKDGHNLSDFKYACVGYSIFLDNNNPNEKQENRVQLPFCAGIEVISYLFCVLVGLAFFFICICTSALLHLFNCLR